MAVHRFALGLARILCKRWRTTSRCPCLLLLLVVLLFAGATRADADERQSLAGGWDARPPYAFNHDEKGITHWAGLDVELLHEIARRAGYFVTAEQVKWADHVEGLKIGEYDIAAQATLTPERAEYARFSIPYRPETMALIVPKGRSQSLKAKNIAELIQTFKDTGFRLGINPDVAYPSKEVRDFLVDPKYQERIVAFGPLQLVTGLLDGEIDGYLTERIFGAHHIERMSAAGHVEEHPVMVHGDLHLMFSKATVPLEVVERFNEAIRSVHEDGTYGRLNAKYAFPILVRLTLDSDWFKAVDIIGTIAFAISGLLLAFRYNYDVFGALVLASLPAVGGGVVRDLITNRGELAVLADPIYIEIIVVLVGGGYFALRLGVMIRKSTLGTRAADHVDRLRSQAAYTVQVCDAIGLAAFTVTGVVVALATHSNPLWIWGPILAAITASGGGILRDVVRSDPEVPALKGELYPEIAVLWGLILSLFFMWDARHLDAGDIRIGIIMTFFGAFITRMLTIHLGLKSPRFST